ncbi:ribonuclease VapC [Aureimonas sp. SA4125]|uniref:type II toxin-antitoxin system VapC family toxin n=1 Tax=Aureimonas sp. SA4125 TaxID=2826993 RepID=UPI001CC5B55B|nr:type II toxin-antitoxin system VapC family toxin [Aureimonas sp. SA4125]BDA86891.1 ribonuclease VapC [Aureimonas sp. SA4125]
MFVDVSALLAMLLDEDEARILAARLQGAAQRLTSPLAALQAAEGVAAALGLPLGESEEAVREFLSLMGIKVMSLPAQLVTPAAEALERFGAGQPAGLSRDDCLAYAAARYYRLPLLYKGRHFAATDIEAA